MAKNKAEITAVKNELKKHCGYKTLCPNIFTLNKLFKP
jgi:hypothetical protein